MFRERRSRESLLRCLRQRKVTYLTIDYVLPLFFFPFNFSSTSISLQSDIYEVLFIIYRNINKEEYITVLRAMISAV
jgi:hypothetical protein